MVNWLSSLEYVKLFKDLKKSLPDLKKSQENPDQPDSKNRALDMLWGIKQLYSKVKEIKDVNIPQVAFLENLDKLPNERSEFDKKVKENMLEVRNQQLCIKNPAGKSEPIADFSSNLLNEIENWALAIFGTFKK